MADDFSKTLTDGYTFQGPVLLLGAPMRDGKVVATIPIGIPLAMMNRHGLIAGATGTGKTKTLQSLAGQLSDAGVACFLADLKGDLSGLVSPGGSHSQVDEPAEACRVPVQAPAESVEVLGL